MGLLSKMKSSRMPSELLSAASSKRLSSTSATATAVEQTPSPPSAPAAAQPVGGGGGDERRDAHDDAVSKGSGLWTDVESRAVSGSERAGPPPSTPSNPNNNNADGNKEGASKAKSSNGAQKKKKRAPSSATSPSSGAEAEGVKSPKDKDAAAASAASPKKRQSGRRSSLSPRRKSTTQQSASDAPDGEGSRQPSKKKPAKSTDTAEASSAKSPTTKSKSVKSPRKAAMGGEDVNGKSNAKKVPSKKKDRAPESSASPKAKSNAKRAPSSKKDKPSASSPAARANARRQSGKPSHPPVTTTGRRPSGGGGRARTSDRAGRRRPSQRDDLSTTSSGTDEGASLESCSYSDDDESDVSSYDSGYTDMDESTMFTADTELGYSVGEYGSGESGSFVSDGTGSYETNDSTAEDDEECDGTSVGFESRADDGSGAGARGGEGNVNKLRGTAAASLARSAAESRKSRGSIVSGRTKSSLLSKTSLGKLAASVKGMNVVDKAQQQASGKDVDAEREKAAQSPREELKDEEKKTTESDKSGSDLESEPFPEEEVKEGGKGSKKTKKASPALVTKSSTMNFLGEMEKFVAKNHEHQLVVVVEENGNIEKLMLQELANVPTPKRGNDIVIKVDASTITLQDCMIRRGKWYEMQNLPFVPGSDFVGTIHSMGEDAKSYSTFQVGDKVAACVPSGGNAKYITIPYHSIIRVPQDTDSVVALCLLSSYVPAREALDLARKLNTPFTSANILVIGGNGPSGLATIELALLEGANVYTTADERHHDFLTNLGAKCFPIDPARWLPKLRGKMDVVLDSVCLDGYESSSLALNSAGTLVCTGMSAVYTQGQIRGFGMRDIRDYRAMYCKMRARYIMKNTLYYDRMERYELAPNEYAQHFRYLCHLAAKDSINPLVAAREPLNLVAKQQKAIEHGDTTYGVCVCTPWTTKSESSGDDEK